MPGPEDIAQGLSKRNDEAAFLRITQALGLNADTVPLSCPYGNGWGGAMGPSQFIPTTWELYQSRIATVTGNNPPNPWNAEDAFAATAIYLKDLGLPLGLIPPSIPPPQNIMPVDVGRQPDSPTATA